MDYIGMATYAALLAASIIVFAVYIAMHTPGTLSIRELLFPRVEQTLRGEVASILIHPLFWIVSSGIITLFTVSLLFSVSQPALAYDWLLFAASVVGLFAVVNTAAVWLFEGKLHEPLRFVIGSLCYGALCALAAFLINTLVGVWLGSVIDQKMSLLILLAVAPFIEEALKMLGVVSFSGHRMFRGTLDGILIGFSIGVGFALTENMFYIITKIPAHSFDLLLFRALYNTIAHGAFSAIGGAVLGKIRARAGNVTLLYAIVATLVAALVHVAFNILAIVDIVGVSSLELGYYIFSPVLSISLLLIVLYLIYYAKKTEKV
ncbi:MAG: PrsW family intramembrane metalloprotease [Candidatus Micrarchaeota archaeon]|nr:PrsW family intramembrane metalloprotease [Candidatus Micrarchaeota archaeon]